MSIATRLTLFVVGRCRGNGHLHGGPMAIRIAVRPSSVVARNGGNNGIPDSSTPLHGITTGSPDSLLPNSKIK